MGVGNSPVLAPPRHSLNVSQLLRSSIHRQRRKMRMDGQRYLLITCLSPAWPETLMWELPPFLLPSKKGHSAHAVCSTSSLEGHKDLSSSCLNPGYHIPYSSVPETGTSQRHGLTGKEWPSSPILAGHLNLLYLLCWLIPPALLLGLAHTYAQSLSMCIYGFTLHEYSVHANTYLSLIFPHILLHLTFHYLIIMLLLKGNKGHSLICLAQRCTIKCIETVNITHGL